MSDPRGIALVVTVAVVYGAIRLVPRLLAGRGAFIAAEELERRLAGPRPPVVVDVRAPGEFAADGGHIPGAVNVPLGELPAWLERTRPTGQDPPLAVVAVCRSDARAALAVRLLRRRGVVGAQALAGGMDAWAEDGRPTVGSG